MTQDASYMCDYIVDKAITTFEAYFDCKLSIMSLVLDPIL